MNISQLTCPSCKEQYTQINPPRFLTMCGHTFCHKCIKTLVTKKKDKGFRIKCPIDKGSMEIDKPNPNLFPKNIVLIDLLQKNNGGFTSNQFLDVSMIEKKLCNAGKENQPSESKLQFSLSSHQNIQLGTKRLCQQHKKVMDVYCLQDFQIICTDCALFSHDRSHEIKNLGELLKIQSQNLNDLTAIKNSKKQSEDNFMNKEIQNQIFDLLDKKKALVQKEISQFFAELKKTIDIKEAEIKEDLQVKCLLTAQRMREKMKLQKSAIQIYRTWDDEVEDIINQEPQDTLENLSRRLQNMIKHGYYEQKIKNGQGIIELMNKKQDQFISSFEKTLNCLIFSYDFEDIELILENFKVQSQIQSPNPQNIQSQTFQRHSRSSSHCQFQSRNSLFQKQNIISQKFMISQCDFSGQSLSFMPEGFQQKEYFKSEDDEQSLLDFDANFDPKPLGLSTLSCSNILVPSVHFQTHQMKGKKEIGSQPKKKQMLEKKLQSSRVSQKSRALSVGSFQVSNKSVTSMKKLASSKPNKTESKFKFQSLISNISGNKVETVDLTGAELKPEELTLILQAIKRSSSVKTVKLMRNKLDDSFIQKHLRFLLSVERLNLAQNKFTQQAVDQALEVLKDNPDHKIQSLNMGQNRIVERKNRKVLEEFKKLSVNIVL